MKITILGLGYIGLPTAALIASKNIKVCGYDVNKEIVSSINKGKAHIREKNLDILLKKAVKKGYLKADTVLYESDIFLIAVPTPIKKNKEPDISFVKSAVKNICKVLKKNNTVILESTIPVGATQEIAKIISSERKDLRVPLSVGEKGDINISYCPERVLPGNILKELEMNDRVIGGINKKSTKISLAFYKSFVKGKCLETDNRTAELCKLVENSYRDANIAFANELSLISENLEIDVWNLIKLANHHPRVNILNPGPGVGGHCIAIDPWFIINSAPRQARLIKLSREINDQMPFKVVSKVKRSLKVNNLVAEDSIITCLGLSFKANIDDLRESPAVKVVNKLKSLNFKKIYLVEPNIKKLPSYLDENKFELVNFKSAVSKSNIVLLLVDHSEFKKNALKKQEGKIIIDTRGIWTSKYK